MPRRFGLQRVYCKDTAAAAAAAAAAALLVDLASYDTAAPAAACRAELGFGLYGLHQYTRLLVHKGRTSSKKVGTTCCARLSRVLALAALGKVARKLPWRARRAIPRAVEITLPNGSSLALRKGTSTASLQEGGRSQHADASIAVQNPQNKTRKITKLRNTCSILTTEA